MRYLVKRIPSTSLVHYDGSRYYCEIAGGTAEKATVDTADLLSGSKYLDVQTGNWYVYDELSNSWALSQEGGSADPAVIEQAVTDWLDAHPEATTTVADGSITEAKLASALAQKVNQVTSLSDEIVRINESIGIADTSPVILQENVRYFTDGTIQAVTGKCITKQYDIDVHGFSSDNCASMLALYVYTPGTTSASDCAILYNADSEQISYVRQNSTAWQSENETCLQIDWATKKIAFTLAMSDIKNSYAYLFNGDVIFAGENTRFYRKKNIWDVFLGTDDIPNHVGIVQNALVFKHKTITEKNLFSCGFGLDTSPIVVACGVATSNASETKIYILKDNVKKCISKAYKLPEKDTQLVVHVPRADTANTGLLWYDANFDEDADQIGQAILGYNSVTGSNLANEISATVPASARFFALTLGIDYRDVSYAYTLPSGTIIFAGEKTNFYGGSRVFDSTTVAAYDKAIGSGWTANANAVISLMRAKITEIDNNCIPFMIETDLHGRVSTPAYYFHVHMPEAMLCMLGDDVGDYYNAKQLEAFDATLPPLGNAKIACVVGNHDVNVNSNATEFPTWIALMNYMKSSKRRLEGDKGNYVVYDDDHNVKYICLQPYDIEKTVSTAMPTIVLHTPQVAWLINQLSSNDGYNIIILNHEPMIYGDNMRTRSGEAYPTVTVSTARQQAWAMFAARNANGSGTITDDDGNQHQYNFTNAYGKILCVLNGHTHEEYITVDSGLVAYAGDWYGNAQCCTCGLIDANNGKLYIYKFTNSEIAETLEIDL